MKYESKYKLGQKVWYISRIYNPNESEVIIKPVETYITGVYFFPFHTRVNYIDNYEVEGMGRVQFYCGDLYDSEEEIINDINELISEEKNV